MSFLTQDELDGLRVTRMIIHVVGRQSGPFEPQSEIDVQQEAFFRARIIDEAADGVHSFEENSHVKRVLEQMSRGAMSFEAGGQNLAERFFEMHVKQSVAGAFFVLELVTGSPNSTLYALIKYDYREAVELAETDGRSVLRAIVQAFVKERRAVQKICLIRISNGTADALVSASDRMKEAPDLTDYFERYLGVARTRSTAELSTLLNEALRASMEEIREHLPSNDVGGAVARAKTALQGRATVSNDDVIDATLFAADRPEDEQIRSKISDVVQKNLRRKKLQDVEFRPDRRMLQVMPRRVVRTAEEVRLEFPYEELGHTVFREDTADGVTFTIHTSRLIQDGTLPDKTRQVIE